MDGSLEPTHRGGDLQVVEIRHRLANCFQLLSGLIGFRLAQTADGESRRQLAWLQEAVVSLGMLQQGLAGAGTAAFRQYLFEVANLWRRLTVERGIIIIVDSDDIALAPGKAAPLSLILHELLTNCCEHAFPNGRGGTIRIAFRHAAEGRAELAVGDDGVGLPTDRPIPQASGLSVVRRLTAQLHGTLSIDGGSLGTLARVDFPLCREQSD
jgi:two-component sensor histidine kinase